MSKLVTKKPSRRVNRRVIDRVVDRRVGGEVLGGGIEQIVIIPKGKDVESIITLLAECFGKYDKSMYSKDTSGSFSHFVSYQIDNKIVGLCSIYDKKKYKMMGHLCVSKDHRGSGISKKIINNLKEQYDWLVWTTKEEAGLDGFYYKMGAYKTSIDGPLTYWRWTSKTYVLSGDSLMDHSIFRGVFADWTEMKRVGGIPPTYIHFDGFIEGVENYDKSLYPVECIMKNLLGGEKSIVTNKRNLSMLKSMQPYIAKSWTIDSGYIPKQYPVLFKPAARGFYSGVGIVFVEDKDQYLEQVAKIKGIGGGKPRSRSRSRGKGKGELSNKSGKGESIAAIEQSAASRHTAHKAKFAQIAKEGLKASDYIVSEAITNVMLLDGKKFHIRVYLAIIMDGLNFDFGMSICPIGKLLTAKEKYKRSDWQNPDIHDTHMGSTYKNYIYPKDCPEIPNADAQVFEICDTIRKALEGKNLSPGPEAPDAYEVFALDILPTVEGRLVLLEVNDKIGLKPSVHAPIEDYREFATEYYRWIGSIVKSRVK